MIASRYATLHELSTSLGVMDLYDLLEVLAVEMHNRNLMQRQQEGV